MLIYIPRCYLPGQELAPSLKLKGCQRVIEPDLSPLLYKPTSAGRQKLIMVFLPFDSTNIK